MLESSEFPYYMGGLPPKIPSSEQSAEKVGESPSSLITQLIIEKIEVPSSPHTRELPDVTVMNQQSIDEGIQKSLSDIHDLEQFPAQIENVELISEFIQGWVADFILKGVAFSIQNGLPPLLELAKLPTDLPHYEAAFENIKFVSDLIEIGTGSAALIYKHRILKTAQKTIANISNMQLDSEQRTRLNVLSAKINQQEQQLSGSMGKAAIKTTRSLVLLSNYAMRFVSHPLVNAVTSGFGYIASGLSCVLYAMSYKGIKNSLKKEHSWKKDFNELLDSELLKIDRTLLEKSQISAPIKELSPVNEVPTPVKEVSTPIKDVSPLVNEVSPLIKELLQTREIRKNTQLSTLETAIAVDPTKKVDIQDKVRQMKNFGLNQFIDNLEKQSLSEVEWKSRLKERLGSAYDSDLAKALYHDYRFIERISDSETHSAEDKADAIADVKKMIAENISQCNQKWIDQQSDKSLLSTYNDYHLVLDSTLKASLSNMIKVKHKVESKFLKMKKTIIGTNLATTAVYFGLSLAVGVLGLATTPFGGAGLILLLCSAGALTVGWGVSGSAYYQSYKIKPDATAALFKGSYLRLYFYYTMAKIQRVQTKSDHWNEKALALEKELEYKGWKDFSKNAKLQISDQPGQFDTLNVLSNTISCCDPSLLRIETKELLKKQLGIDVDGLQDSIKNEPEMKRMISSFFNLEPEDLIKFIERQKEMS